MLRVLFIIGLLIGSHPVFATKLSANEADNVAVNQTLKRFHLAAAEANSDEYFQLFADDAIFLGTDGGERWTKEAFKAYVTPHFSKGNGWLYQKVQRNISLVEGTNIAFFDEILFNKNYGKCRGTGVLIKVDNEWKILQYNLSIPVPNELSKDVVGLIQNASNVPK